MIKPKDDIVLSIYKGNSGLLLYIVSFVMSHITKNWFKRITSQLNPKMISSDFISSVKSNF